MSATKIAAVPLFFVLWRAWDDAGVGTALVNLAATVTDDPARASTVMTWGRADHEGIELGEEAGAIEWNITTGRCERIYVQPRWRRRGVGTALLREAENVARQSNLPGITVASVRTALGEVWVRATGAAAEPLTMLSWPLTPPEDIEGITDRRLLIPDRPDALRPIAEEFAAGSDAGRAVGKTLDTACGPACGVPLHRWKQ